MTARKPATPTDRELLEWLRDELKAAIAVARSADEDKQAPVASLARQLRETLAALAALPAEKERSTTDELRKRRAARLANSQVRADPSSANVGGAGGSRTSRQRGAASGPVAGKSAARRTRGSA